MLEWLQQWRSIVLVVLGALLAIFAIQNLATVELNLFFWSIRSRRIVVIALCLGIGLAIGWLYGYNAGRKAYDHERD